MGTTELRKSMKPLNGLKFHDVIYRRTMGIIAAFVICKDGGNHKYYWGRVSGEGKADDLYNIMKTGAKWRGTNDDGDILL